MKKPTKSFEIALSSIACAFAAGFLMLGTVNPFLLATGYLVASFSIMIPLSQGFVFGSLLCYMAAGLLALPLGLWKIVPYAVFFGLHPIVNYLQKKHVKKFVWNAAAEVLKTVWFVLAMWLSYFILKSFAGFTFPETVEQYLYLVLFLGGTVFFAAYDFMIFRCQRSADVVIKRIRR